MVGFKSITFPRAARIGRIEANKGTNRPIKHPSTTPPIDNTGLISSEASLVTLNQIENLDIRSPRKEFTMNLINNADACANAIPNNQATSESVNKQKNIN